MFATVIPAKNEENRIGQVINNVLNLPVDIIIPVINGCTDNTLKTCFKFPSDKIHIIHFREALGIDVPRAVGAYYAFKLGAQGVLFIDGDMTGNITGHLQKLIFSISCGVDCALTNCYPYIYARYPLTTQVLRYREMLNRKLNLFHQLGLASASHGPHAVSRHLLKTIPLEALAIPPVEVTLAKKHGLIIKVCAAFPHGQMGSPDRSSHHAQMIAHTIIGDCLEGMSILNGLPRNRSEFSFTYNGYNPQRRFDILRNFCKNTKIANIYHLK